MLKVYSASDIVSLILIFVQIKCFIRFFSKLTEKVNTCGDDILTVQKAVFGWSGIPDKASSSIRKAIAKIVLLPKFVFSLVAFFIEWGILYSENVSLPWWTMSCSWCFYFLVHRFPCGDDLCCLLYRHIWARAESAVKMHELASAFYRPTSNIGNRIDPQYATGYVFVEKYEE